MDRTEIEEQLAAETWLTAKEAVEMGFADKVLPEKKLAAKFDLHGLLWPALAG